MEREIKIVNRIIKEAVIHGADAGGSYDQNEENLCDAILVWIEMKGLSEQYTIKDIPVGGGWGTYQIVKR